MRHLLPIAIFFLLSLPQAFNQCSIESADGYSVEISMVPGDIIVNSDICPIGYNWDVEIDYNIQFAGDNIPDALFTLQGTLFCSDGSSFFDLPNDGGMGTTTTTGNIFSNCDDSTLVQLGCDSISLTIQGPGIDTTISCSFTFSICPDDVQLATNDSCILISYDSIVPPLPDSILFMDEVFYRNSTITGQPYEYLIDESNPCSASTNPLDGDLIIGLDTCTFTNGVLPVQLISFDLAERPENSIQLNWVVQQEIDLEGYIVEHSVNAQDWDEMAFVPSKRNELGRLEYEFHTSFQEGGVHYFRLIMVDFDGSNSTSQVISVVIQHANDFVIFPNPVVNEQLFIQGISEEGHTISVIDVLGREVYTQDLTSGEVSLHQLQSGLYYLKIRKHQRDLKVVKILKP